MRICLLLGLCLLAINTGFTKVLDLDQLLAEVKKAHRLEGKINKSREEKFLREKDSREKLLFKARAELAKQEALSERLKTQLETNEAELSVLETELSARSGILDELFGVARQAAGDLRADLEGSLISAQYPERAEKLSQLASSKALPSLEQLQSLWFILQQEMTESGKVVRFNTEIYSPDGDPRAAEVIRIGNFNALAGGNYLRYLPGPGKLVELARQPEEKYLGLAQHFVASKSGRADLGVDPTRGVMLSLLVLTPNSIERIEQGGAIGYIILLLGAFGFFYALFRYVKLIRVDRKMTLQVNDLDSVSNDNPLGRIMLVLEKSTVRDAETLDLLLDEAVTREIPLLEKGLSMVKLLAGVAPLLGLLGTVTGMIATFQSISLFGTGDPKLMANGISQALVTTMLGLMVAIPLLFIHSLLASRSRKLSQILDEQTAGIIARRSEQ